jgi:Flp pilus assembly protein protease CpaA
VSKPEQPAGPDSKYLTALKLLAGAVVLLHYEGAETVAAGLDQVVTLLCEKLTLAEKTNLLEAADLMCAGGQLTLTLKRPDKSTHEVLN